MTIRERFKEKQVAIDFWERHNHSEIVPCVRGLCPGYDTPEGATVTPWADPGHDILGDIRKLMQDAEASYPPRPAPMVTLDCGHEQPAALPFFPDSQRFCFRCGTLRTVETQGDT